MPELEKPLWSVSIHYVPRLQASLEKSLWFFCSISVSSPELPWDLSGVGFRGHLGHLSLLTPNFVPNRSHYFSGSNCHFPQ